VRGHEVRGTVPSRPEVHEVLLERVPGAKPQKGPCNASESLWYSGIPLVPEAAAAVFLAVFSACRSSSRYIPASPAHSRNGVPVGQRDVVSHGPAACSRVMPATPTTSGHVNSGFSGGSQDLAMCGEEHGGSGRDRTGPRPTAGLHPRQMAQPCGPSDRRLILADLSTVSGPFRDPQ
jgi:hypothetical protein